MSRHKFRKENTRNRYGKSNFNRRHTKLKLGDHLVQCDISGQVCFASETMMTWKGLIVSKQNFDPRQPQLDIYIDPENVAIDNARPFQGSDLAVGNDVQGNGQVSYTSADIEQAAGVCSTVFSPNGQLTNNGSDVAGEWWSTAPTSAIGNFYQIRFTRYAEVGGANIVSVDGPLGRFVSLTEARTLTTTFSGTGYVDYYIEIKDIVADKVVATGGLIHRQT